MAQGQPYRDSVLPPNIHARLAVEAGCRQGWKRWVGDQGSGVGVNRAAPRPGELVLKKYGFTVDNVVAKAKAKAKALLG